MNELGELRPSQLIFTFGVGSLVDLPDSLGQRHTLPCLELWLSDRRDA